MRDPPQALPSLSTFPLEGRVVLVTGGTRGLGRAIADRLAAAGAKVAIVSRSTEDCQQVAADLAAAHGIGTLGIGADVADWTRVDDIVTRTVEGLGGLDFLINNAGTGTVQPIGELDDATIERIFALNLSSAMALSRAALPALERSGQGRIVNISSVLGLVGRELRTAYGAAKGALIAFTRSLAIELVERRITVNAIAPGQFFTSLTEEMWNDDVKRESVTALIPARRWGHPTELVEMVVPLLTGRGGYVTGQTIVVDGGWSL